MSITPVFRAAVRAGVRVAGGCLAWNFLFVTVELSHYKGLVSVAESALFIPPFHPARGVFDNDALRGEFRADGVGAGVDAGEDVRVAQGAAVFAFEPVGGVLL